MVLESLSIKPLLLVHLSNVNKCLGDRVSHVDIGNVGISSGND
jgi:hypothetical protein